MAKVEKISAHITYAEATKSQESIRLGIPNEPNAEQLAAMQHLAESVFEPLRAHFGKPIGISSFFRSPVINDKIGGAKGSQHTTGEAMDIDADIFGGITNAQVFEHIRESYAFDQLIWEFGDDASPAWVHVSRKKEGNRGQCLRAYKDDQGFTKYKPFA